METMRRVGFYLYYRGPLRVKIRGKLLLGIVLVLLISVLIGWVGLMPNGG